MVPVEAGGFGEEDDSNAEHECPDVTDAHGDAVGACVVTGFGAVVDAVGGEDSDCDEELVAAERVSILQRCDCCNNLRDHSASDVHWGGLGHVHRDEDGESTNAQSCCPSSHDNANPVAGSNCHLCYYPNAEDHTPDGYTPFSTEFIRERACDQAADQSSD